MEAVGRHYKVPNGRGPGAVVSGRYSGQRLFRQAQFQLIQKQLVIPFGLSVSGQHQVAAVGGRQMHIDHLQGGEFFQDRPGRQPRRPRPGQVLQGHMQTVGDEGHEDVRLDPVLALVEDRPDGQIVLEFLERLLDLGQSACSSATAWPDPRRSGLSATDSGLPGDGPGAAGRGAG